ncbi:GDP-mannose 4,6-dehydratase [Candidatus Roizmanbacteria bacterium]|nr:GDP-mannose 4,6-dehydratase [Candidatus Roizmanbacteria bacterium]
MEIKDQNVLVTGGTGFVGSHLVEELVRREANVTTTFITTNPKSYFFSQKLHKKVRMTHVDVNDFNELFDVVTKYEVDYIFHLAAQALVGTAYYNPQRTFATNVMGTVNVMESVRLYPRIKGAIVASSDKAYGKLKKDKYVEEDSLKGDHPYESSKSAADIIANSYFKTYQLPVCTTRFGNIYGEGDLNYSRIVPGIMRSMVTGETLEVRSNGKYVRDYLYVKDVVDGYMLLADNIDKLKGEPFNFGSDETLSVLEVIQHIQRLLKKKLRYKILDAAKNEIPYQSLDYSKIKKKLGWKPKYNFKKTAEKIYKWYKKIS